MVVPATPSNYVLNCDIISIRILLQGRASALFLFYRSGSELWRSWVTPPGPTSLCWGWYLKLGYYSKYDVMFSPAGSLLSTSSQLCGLKKALYFSLEQCMRVTFRLRFEPESKTKIYQMHSKTGKLKKKNTFLLEILFCGYKSNLRYYWQ